MDDATRQETLAAMNQAANEIEALRRHNEVLQAQVNVVNVFAAALLGPPRPSGATVDPLWQLRRAAQKLQLPAKEE